MVLAQDAVDGFFRVVGAGQGFLYLLVSRLKAISFEEVICKSRDVHIFSFQSCASQAQIIADIAPHSRQDM